MKERNDPDASLTSQLNWDQCKWLTHLYESKGGVVKQVLKGLRQGFAVMAHVQNRRIKGWSGQRTQAVEIWVQRITFHHQRPCCDCDWISGASCLLFTDSVVITVDYPALRHVLESKQHIKLFKFFQILQLSEVTWKTSGSYLLVVWCLGITLIAPCRGTGKWYDWE